jgi:hypothetical protein
MSNDQELKDILLTVDESIKDDLSNYIHELLLKESGKSWVLRIYKQADRVIILGTIPLLVLRKLITNPSFYFLKNIYFQAPLYIKGKVLADLTLEELEAKLQSANINY